MKDERASYVERTPWPGFATAILWGVVVLSCYPILAGWDTDLPFNLRWPIVVAIVAGAAGLQTVVGGLTVRVEKRRIVVHLGTLPMIRKALPYEDILEMKPVVYRPIREFGGWGVRGFGKRRAWSARGNRAVRLTLTEGRELLIGSDHPQRLEERIRAVAGDRLGVERPADA